MTANQKDPLLTYALDSSGKMVCIDNVKRGYSCNCRCPKCKKPLLAKLGHGRRQPHFAHESNSDCHGAYMSALHKLAEQIIEEEKSVMLPEYHEIDSQKLTFECVEVEQRIDRKDLQPDLVGVSADGKRWIIEIRNSHEVDEEKKSKLIESNLTCLEIDVREQTLENLRTFLLESTESRKWINNPFYDFQIKSQKREAVFKVVSYLNENRKLMLPPYSGQRSKFARWKSVSLFYESEDGLFVKVKAISLEGDQFIFNIGNKEKLEGLDIEEECNILTINTDDLKANQTIHFYDLDVKWSYNYKFEREQESEIEKYRNNPQFEVVSKYNCENNCNYKPFDGKCIYMVKTLPYNDKEWVVCKKDKRERDAAEYNHTKKEFHTEYSINERKETSSILQECEDEISSSVINKTRNDLPFEAFWAIKDYFKELQKTGSYETENGFLAEIIKCNITKQGILLLYRDTEKQRTYCPYHIDIISSNNGVINRNKVAVFPNKYSALNSYSERLEYMGKIECEKSIADYYSNDLPF